VGSKADSDKSVGAKGSGFEWAGAVLLRKGSRVIYPVEHEVTAALVVFVYGAPRSVVAFELS